MSIEQVVSNVQSLVSDPILAQGDRGAAVIELQTLLNAKGARLVVDGDFGLATKAAVIKFQQQNDLRADGIVVSSTWAALRKSPAVPLRLVDAGLNYQPARFPHQQAAAQWLEAQIAYPILREFMQRWDNAAIQPDPVLQQGDRGATVQRLQRLLNAAGASLVADGAFGSGTRAAVIRFQREQGLSADGVVGEQTWGLLFRLVGERRLPDFFSAYRQGQSPKTTAALEWLQTQVSIVILTEFATRWRNP
jgi:peptidoglycan hydrolase-like protein with peptidoglycan-binding domain